MDDYFFNPMGRSTDNTLYNKRIKILKKENRGK